MSSRSADLPAPPRRWRLSLTGRLVLCSTLSSCAMLAATVAFLYASLTRGLEDDANHFVADRVQVLRGVLARAAGNVEVLDHEVRWASGVHHPKQAYVFYARIFDAHGQLLLETPGMDHRLPAAAFPPAVAEAQAELTRVVRHWENDRGQAFMLLSAWARRGHDGAPLVVQVALDHTPEAELIAGYQRYSLLALAGGTLLCALLGILGTRRSLRPLRQMAATAERITASRLDERLDPARCPKELAGLAQAFNRMLGRLQDSFSRLSGVSADLAHELRTPIHALMGEAEVALAKGAAAADYEQVLAASLEEYERLSRLINELLFLARAEDPRTRIEPAAFAVGRELAAVQAYHAVLAEDKDITLSCAGDGELVADPLLFRRAVSNLLANALRHTPPGGRVEVRALRHGNGTLAVTVRDNGSGIAPQHLPFIFDRFYRPDQGVTPATGSTGLGLSIVHSIMELHGGSVDVASAPGQGATFTLRFPARPPSADRFPPPAKDDQIVIQKSWSGARRLIR